MHNEYRSHIVALLHNTVCVSMYHGRLIREIIEIIRIQTQLWGVLLCLMDTAMDGFTYCVLS